MDFILKAKAIELWQQSKTSYEIAAELKVSRYAVLGVIKRHRDKGNDVRCRLVKVGVKRSKNIQKPKPVEVLFNYPEPVVGVSLMGLRHMSCRFIIAEDESPIYCGKDKVRGSYCADHYSVCYVPVRKEDRKKIERLSRIV